MSYIQLIIISLAISSISFTISKTEIFKPIRLFICKYSNFFGKLVSCPYCLSHWVAFTIMLYIYRSFCLDLIIMTFASITLSMIGISFINRALDFMIQDD